MKYLLDEEEYIEFKEKAAAYDAQCTGHVEVIDYDQINGTKTVYMFGNEAIDEMARLVKEGDEVIARQRKSLDELERQIKEASLWDLIRGNRPSKFTI